MSGGALPLSTMLPSSVSLGSVQPTRVSVSHSMKRQARTGNAQRWGITLGWESAPRVVYSKFYAFLLGQRGQADTFTTTLPGSTAPQGTWAGTPVVAGAAQTGRVVNLSGFTANQANAVRAGDLMQFAGSTKVYMATADAASSGTGTASVSIEPALVVSPANLAAVTVNNVTFTVALSSDTLASNLGIGDNYSWSITMVEVY